MWKAVFNDGSELMEYDSRGREILFKAVMDRVAELKTLSIELSSTKIFTVSMRDSRFTVNINGISNKFYGIDIEKYDVTQLQNIRPIYFIRERVDFRVNNSRMYAGTPPQITFTALGFQANYVGKNIKCYLSIFPDGEYIIKTE